MQDTLDITGGLRIRFCMIVFRLFYSCTVKGYNKGLQQWCDWRGYKGTNLLPDKLNAKTEPPFSLYVGIQYSFSKLLFLRFLEVSGLLFSGDLGF